MDILIPLLFFLVGYILGRVVKKNDGFFIIDDSEDETTRWILDVKIDPKEILNKKEIRLKVRKLYRGDV